MVRVMSSSESQIGVVAALDPLSDVGISRSDSSCAPPFLAGQARLSPLQHLVQGPAVAMYGLNDPDVSYRRKIRIEVGAYATGFRICTIPCLALPE